MRISDWSSDVCSSDLKLAQRIEEQIGPHGYRVFSDSAPALEKAHARNAALGWIGKNTLLMRRDAGRSEEHTSELQSLMRISYAVFCLKKKKHNRYNTHTHLRE